MYSGNGVIVNDAQAVVRSASLRFLYAPRPSLCTVYRPAQPDSVISCYRLDVDMDVISLEVLYGFGGFCAIALLAYLVYALIRAEEF